MPELHPAQQQVQPWALWFQSLEQASGWSLVAWPVLWLDSLQDRLSAVRSVSMWIDM